MDDLLSQLQSFGFSEEYLQAIKEQDLIEIEPTNIKVAEYTIYDHKVDYMTDIIYTDNGSAEQ